MLYAAGIRQQRYTRMNLRLQKKTTKKQDASAAAAADTGIGTAPDMQKFPLILI